MPVKYMLLLSLMTMVHMGCRKDLTELNINPNEPTSTSPDYLFKYALMQGVGSYNSDVSLEQWGIMNWVMFMAARGGMEEGKEYIIPSAKDDYWREQYSNTVSNLQAIIDEADNDPEMVNLYAAAIIWKVCIFHKITDLWGAIPYKEALKGISGLNYAPAYDTQEEIYGLMLEELATAVELLDETKRFYQPESDLIYEGDMKSWEALGNSLRLRLATRLNKTDPLKYEEVVGELIDKPLISTNTSSACFPFNSVFRNHLYETMLRGESTIQNNPSKFLADLLVNTDDPRTPNILEEAPLSFLPVYPKYNGVPNLLLNTDEAWNTYNPDGQWGDISRIGEWYLRNGTPGVIFSYAEVCFLKSEAALNGLWPGDKDILLKEGVRADMEFFALYADGTYEIAEEDIQAYLDKLPAADLEQIITQKWISFVFENGYEAYAEYRRTGYPVLLKYDMTPINDGIFPLRLIYPFSEFTLNRDNYKQAVQVQGPDTEFTPLWWDE